MNKNKYLIILVLITLFSLPILFFVKENTLTNKYSNYDLALESALNAKFNNYSKEEQENSIKLFEKKIENKSILFFKTKLLIENDKLADTIFIIEIDKKNNKYMYNVTPNISLGYDEQADQPYSLTEGVININKNKNLYYGIGKIIDKSYKLVTKNKNYNDLCILKDNVFIITDEKKYQKIQFEKIN